MSDKKYYVCDGASLSHKRKVYGPGEEVSKLLGEERCEELAGKKHPIVSTSKPESLKAKEKAAEKADENAKKREKADKKAAAGAQKNS